MQQVVDELVKGSKCTHQKLTVNVRDVAKNDGAPRFDRNLIDCQHVRYLDGVTNLPALVESFPQQLVVRVSGDFRRLDQPACTFLPLIATQVC